MPDNNFLAFQYALGLLNKQERQAIERAPAFEQALKNWQLYLTKLNLKAPLSKQSADQIWHNINHQIKPKKVNIIHTLLNTWRYTLGAFVTLSLIFSLTFFNQNATPQLGWDIHTNLSKKQLFIISTTHKHTDESNAYTLWVKKDNKILRIGLMPETGQKIINITPEMLAMIQDGEMIISFEDKENPVALPTIIDYQHKWIT
ncbi:MAG: hypothetical protein Rsou_0148 [Candidatus Ruthia sp. Asou_11_S2]|nr:hypothetical protein [Candidatus Ruthia sp. Asou_11_S2]